MELFAETASEEEFAGIAGLQAGSPQVEKLKAHLSSHPDDNAECLAWLYTLRGDSTNAERALLALPEDRRAQLKTRMDMIAEDVRNQQEYERESQQRL